MHLIFLFQAHKMLEYSSISSIQEAVALGFLELFHNPGKENPTNLLTKILDYQKAIPYLCPLLFWCRDMSDIPMKGLD